VTSTAGAPGVELGESICFGGRPRAALRFHEGCGLPPPPPPQSIDAIGAGAEPMPASIKVGRKR